MDDGWFYQPHLVESDWTLGLGEAAHLLHIEYSVGQDKPAITTHSERYPVWQHGAPGYVALPASTFNPFPPHHSPLHRVFGRAQS